MKKNNRGFTLFETLLISTFIVGTLVYLFSQFVILKNNYNNSFKYNTVEALYKGFNADRYLSGVEARKIVNQVNNSSLKYIDITSCSYFDSSNYCGILFSALNIKTAIIAKGGLEGLKNALENNNPYDEGLYKFVKNQKIKEDDSKYYLIIKYNDDTYTNIVLSI